MSRPTNLQPGTNEIARRASVPVEFVERLLGLGAISPDAATVLSSQLGRVRLLHAWSQTGLPVETILRLVERGALSITFLDAPAVEAPPRLNQSYGTIAADRGIEHALVERLHEAIGFEPPNPKDNAGVDDPALLDVVELFHSVGVPEEPVLRLLGVYAEALHRLAKAEAELYEANIEEGHRTSGITDRELMELGTYFGN